MMVISPDSVTAVAEITAPAGITPSAQGNSAGGAANVPPGHSGAGIARQAGNKNGLCELARRNHWTGRQGVAVAIRGRPSRCDRSFETGVLLTRYVAHRGST